MNLQTPGPARLKHSLPVTAPPAGSFDTAIAERGRVLFDRTCASCHVGGAGTDNNTGTLHPPADTGVDGAYAARTANKAYRTTPLRALWQHAAVITTTSAFAPGVACEFASVMPLRLQLRDGKDLPKWLQRFLEKK
jgi:cytochrome c2